MWPQGDNRSGSMRPVRRGYGRDSLVLSADAEAPSTVGTGDAALLELQFRAARWTILEVDI